MKLVMSENELDETSKKIEELRQLTFKAERLLRSLYGDHHELQMMLEKATEVTSELGMHFVGYEVQKTDDDTNATR